MATIQELVLRLRTDSSQFVTGLGVSSKEFSSWSKKIQTMAKVTTVATLAVAGLSVKAFASFDAAMTESLAIMGDVSDEMRGEMVAAAREMARRTTFSATQAAESYFFLASAGLDAASSVQALPVVARFAQAGMFDMAQATDLLTDAQSALGLTIRNDAVANMQNMIKVSDVLVKANTLANASVQQFSESLTNRAAAGLRMVNKDIEEGVAVLAAFADQGVKGAEAGTRLDIVLRDLQSKAVENKEVFARFNVQVFDASGNMRNMADIIGDLERAMAGASDETKRATIMQLGFSDRSVASLLTLLGFSEQIRNYEAALREAGGTTEEVARKQLETLTAQLTLAKNAMVDIGITVGGFLAPAIVKLAQGVQKMPPALVITTVAVGGLISGLTTLAFLLPNVVRGFQLMTAVLPLLMGGPWGLVALAGVLLAAGAAFVIFKRGADDATAALQRQAQAASLASGATVKQLTASVAATAAYRDELAMEIDTLEGVIRADGNLGRTRYDQVEKLNVLKRTLVHVNDELEVHETALSLATSAAVEAAAQQAQLAEDFAQVADAAASAATEVKAFNLQIASAEALSAIKAFGKEAEGDIENAVFGIYQELVDKIRREAIAQDELARFMEGAVNAAGDLAAEVFGFETAADRAAASARAGASATSAAEKAQRDLTAANRDFFEVIGRIRDTFLQEQIDAYLTGGQAQLNIVLGQQASLKQALGTTATDLVKTFGIDLPTALGAAMDFLTRGANNLTAAAEQAAAATAKAAGSNTLGLLREPGGLEAVRAGAFGFNVQGNGFGIGGTAISVADALTKITRSRPGIGESEIAGIVAQLEAQQAARFAHVGGMADGGIVRARPGGVLATIGEGRHDEAVIPLDGKSMGGSVTVNIYVEGSIHATEDLKRVAVDGVTEAIDRGGFRGRLATV